MPDWMDHADEIGRAMTPAPTSHSAAVGRALEAAAKMTDADLADRLMLDAQTIEIAGMSYAPTMIREAANRLRQRKSI